MWAALANTCASQCIVRVRMFFHDVHVGALSRVFWISEVSQACHELGSTGLLRVLRTRLSRTVCVRGN